MSVSMQGFSVVRFASIGGLKSTQERQERQQKCASQVEFFEKQKENLKSIQCTSLEDIARKLDMFHSYEDQIAAAKQQYNNSQMSHVLDEAREIGEKIAEKAEEMAPKTEEERKKDRIEEALGTEDENKGMLSEIMDEMTEELDELQEELEEELEEQLEQETLEEGALEELEENAAQTGELSAEETSALEEQYEDIAGTQSTLQENVVQSRLEQEVRRKQRQALEQTMIFTANDARYRHIDYRL